MSEPSYPLTMPTTPNFSRSEWRLEKTVAMTQSPFTYASQTHEFTGAIWVAQVTLPPMSREQASEWQAFYMQLHGTHGTFLMGDPDAKSPLGNALSNISVNGAHSIGAYDIAMDGFNASVTNVFKKGDYVQFGSGSTSKLHMVVANTSSNASGEATVAIEPPLKTALADDAVVLYTNAKAVMRMDNNDLGWNANENSIYGMSFSCSEVL
tara:strand:- start:2296 stop:2922 length:627 start_codon:yes stop_codon:yes gene_type:complete